MSCIVVLISFHVLLLLLDCIIWSWASMTIDSVDRCVGLSLVGFVSGCSGPVWPPIYVTIIYLAPLWFCDFLVRYNIVASRDRDSWHGSRVALWGVTGKISYAADTAKPVVIQDILMKSTMDSMFKIGYGVELDVLASSDDLARFRKAFDDANSLVFRRYLDFFWPIKWQLNIGSEAELKRNIKVIDKFVFQLIQLKREQMMKGEEQKTKGDILSRFILASEEEADKKLSDRYLRDIILSFLIAGKDTTATTLSWFFYLLCKHPLVQEKIAADVKEVMKMEGCSIAEFAMGLSDEAIDKMHYLHPALTETLRLYPAVPVDGKCADEDDVLPDGFKVNKGDGVSYLIYAMGRMAYLWGEDAEDFRPERWLQNGIFKPESPYKFVTFKAGPRICLGKEFAYLQMKIFAATILHFFKLKLKDEAKIARYRTMFTLQMAEDLPLLVFPRGV